MNRTPVIGVQLQTESQLPVNFSILRSLVETVIDELKNLCQIEHTRHHSPANFTVNLLAGLIAYCLMPAKPKRPLQSAYALSNPHLVPN